MRRIALGLFDNALQSVQLGRGVRAEVVIALDTGAVVRVDRRAAGPGCAVAPVVVGSPDPAAVHRKWLPVVAEHARGLHPGPALALAAGAVEDPSLSSSESVAAHIDP